MTAKRERLDERVVRMGLAENRSRAASLIMAGNVLVEEVPCTKAGTLIRPEKTVRLKAPDHPWVSRGGLKLMHALECFSLVPLGWIAADIGCSTGGFTDVLLTHGASKVYAVDVGHGQLDWKLRSDPRVVVMEKTNARHLTAEQIPDSLDLVVCDASFISLTVVLPAVLSLVKKDGLLIALIKPQFEAGRGEVGKGGVVRDTVVHTRVCNHITTWLTEQGWQILGLTPSPITGPKGNVEFLVGARLCEPAHHHLV